MKYDFYSEGLDPERIQNVDWGHYQGTLVFVIGEAGCQPENHFGVSVGYGSCSGCDTMAAICEMEAGKEKVDVLMREILHLVQGLTLI